jgi:hypothetical protein
MLFKSAVLDGIAAGHITLAFRRWRRPTVRAGGTLRTAIGVLAIDAVDCTDPDAITDDEAHLAGYRSRDALVTDLARRSDGEVYRVAFHLAGEDPRIALRQSAPASEAEIEALRKRLDRLDGASRGGPWTRETLEAIAAHPAVRAGDLAADAGIDVPRFKRNVRKLKELGLTESLEVGYRLSPRGEALVRAIE